MERIVPARHKAVKATNWQPLRTVSANWTFLLEDGLVGADTTGGAVTLTLRAASSVPPGTIFGGMIVAGGNDLNFAPTGADTIDSVGAPYSCFTTGVRGALMMSDGVSAWASIGTSALAGAAAAAAAASNITQLLGYPQLTAGALAVDTIPVTVQWSRYDGATFARTQRLHARLYSADMVELATASFTIGAGAGATAISTDVQADLYFGTGADGAAIINVSRVGAFAGTIYLEVTPVTAGGALGAPGTPTMIPLVYV